MGALAQFKQPELINRTLEFNFSEAVRSQDSLFGIMHVLANRHGRRLAWSFIQDQWLLIKERYAEGMMLSHITEQLGNVFATHEMADKIERFFANNAVPSIKRSVQQCLERIRLQADWFTRDEANIREFLETTKLD